MCGGNDVGTGLVQRGVDVVGGHIDMTSVDRPVRMHQHQIVGVMNRNGTP